MITKNAKFTLSVISLFSVVFATSTGVAAAPVRFSQVKQVVNAKPGKANSGNYSNLRLADDPVGTSDDDDDEKTGTRTPQQDDRVITETRTEIVEETDCDCDQPPAKKRFPYWTLLGLAAIPAVIILTRDDDDETPTPTPTTPTPTPTTPTPTPTTPTPTPKTPTPTPPTEPVPEPMTILLFGTGLAGVGLAARKRFGRREDEDEDEG